jgi:chemotaxis protein MotB
MRSLALLVPVFALTAGGCKKDELQAALDEANAKLSDTQGMLDAEKKTTAELRAENQTLNDRIAELEGEIKQLEAQIAQLANEAGITQRELEELRKEKAKREKELDVYKSLFAELKALVDAGTVKVAFRKGRLVVEMASSILFDSGKASLREEGQTALGQLATALGSVGERDFLIAGHTDNVPIRTARFKSNWELSTARAVQVVNYMIEAGMSPVHIGAAGFGEYDPVGDNKAPEGRAQNRRIEIILMPNLGDIPGMQEMLRGG